MTNDFSDVAHLFSSATGFATRLNTWATSVSQTGGLIDIRTKNLNTEINGYNDQITKLEARMTILQQQYTAEYSNLNMLLSNMNSTSAYLNQQFYNKSTA
jgi:flagellar hook-associated protein 2